MKKILVIFTGGTIGSKYNSEYVALDSKAKYFLIEDYIKNNSEMTKQVEFDTVSPINILSENMTGVTMSTIINCIRENVGKGYDGIIVTHGSDTLQYTATMADFILNDTNAVVVFVASNFPLYNEMANGRDNFKYAVDFIVNGKNNAENNAKSGVYISYRNTDMIARIYKASRTIQHLAYSDNLYEIDDLTRCAEGIFKGANGQDEELADCNHQGKYHLNLPSTDNSKVLRLYPYPGATYNANLDSIKAILLDTYHSGTLCNTEASLYELLENANAKGIPVYVAGATPGYEYESVDALKKYNIRFLKKMSPIAAYIKLWLGVCSGVGNLDQYMDYNICGEMQERNE